MKAKIFLICALGLLLSGCKKEAETIRDYIFNVEFRLTVSAPDGTDLLDQNNSTHLDFDKIRVSYIDLDGKEIFIDRPMTGRQYGWVFDNRTSSIWTSVEPIPIKDKLGYYQDRSYKMQIYWNDKIVDTFQSGILCDHSMTIIGKEVIYNNEVIWQGSDADSFFNNRPVHNRVIDYKDL